MRKRAAIVLLAGLALGACGKARAPFLSTTAPSPVASAAKPDSGFLSIPPVTPPPPDAGNLCGRAVEPVVIERPNFYFVLDSSGSMSELMPVDQASATGIVPTRYTAAIIAIRELLRAVGHRISYGATVFPDADAAGCTPGTEVFPTQPGDKGAYARTNHDGPIEQSLFDILASRTPNGLTPTAASLQAVKKILAGLTGKTYAFLLTDGAPNCDDSVPCNAANCTVNIEGLCVAGEGRNCCDPAYGVYDYRWCLDADPTTKAVADLATAGIETFVIGMPGTDAYANVLDGFAEAGQTARPSKPEYYPVQNATDLVNTLREIGLSLALSCDVALATVPPDPNLVNVFFDDSVVPEDDQNGWTWTNPTTVRLVGKSCDQLKAGSVEEVQVVAGCPSVTR